jgi:hypothetical protein
MTKKYIFLKSTQTVQFVINIVLSEKIMSTVKITYKSSLPKADGCHHDLVNCCGMSMSQLPQICSVCHNHSPVGSSFMFVRKITWQVPHVEQEVPTHPEHLSSCLVFSHFNEAINTRFVVFIVSSNNLPVNI